MKLGKLPARPLPTDLQYDHYRRLRTWLLPDFGLDAFVAQTGWGMLGNDRYGDCVWAGAAHEHMVLTGGGHRVPIAFNANGVLGDYSACTGFDPSDPSTDQGTDVHQSMSYRQHTGIMDAAGARHKIGAYLSIDPSNQGHILEAAYQLEACGIGIQFPYTAMTQFNNGLPWDVTPNTQIDGGHYVPVIGYRSHKVPALGTTAHYFEVVTWGQLQLVTPAFITKYCDEAWAFVSPDDLTSTGFSVRGYDMAALAHDLAAL